MLTWIIWKVKSNFPCDLDLVCAERRRDDRTLILLTYSTQVSFVWKFRVVIHGIRWCDCNRIRKQKLIMSHSVVKEYTIVAWPRSKCACEELRMKQRFGQDSARERKECVWEWIRNHKSRWHLYWNHLERGTSYFGILNIKRDRICV